MPRVKKHPGLLRVQVRHQRRKRAWAAIEADRPLRWSRDFLPAVVGVVRGVMMVVRLVKRLELRLLEERRIGAWRREVGLLRRLVGLVRGGL